MCGRCRCSCDYTQMCFYDCTRAGVCTWTCVSNLPCMCGGGPIGLYTCGGYLTHGGDWVCDGVAGFSVCICTWFLSFPDCVDTKLAGFCDCDAVWIDGFFDCTNTW